ncbi:glycosyltransferase family 39 protein [bacterium]|nr:glycosyltransferase family 39 protein [bacterium]
MKREHIIFILIILLSFILRILFIDKPYGFWHNEMVMYNQTIAGNIMDIIKASVDADVHFPLYQIFLAGWMKIFGNGDTAIRMFSVLAGVLAVLGAYLTGKEIKDEKTGNLFAVLCAINSVFIFYSQEVKFYIFLTTYSIFALYFLVRLIKYSKIPDYAGYIFFNLFIVYTFTIGILYVFAQAVVALIYIIFKRREILKNFIIANLIMVGLILPFAIFVITNMGKYQSAAWIFTSNFYTLFVLIQNYFSPCLISVYNNPPIYIPPFGILYIIFLYIPVGIMFYAMYKAIRNNKSNWYIFAVSILFLLLETVLCMNSGLRMLTRYTILAVPPLLLLAGIGFSYLKSKTLKILLTYLLVINISCIVFFPNSAVRGYRELGEKPVAQLMTQENISQNDAIVLALRKNDFDKYLTADVKKFSLLQDFVHEPYALNPDIKDRYEAYWDYVGNYDTLNTNFEKDFKSRVLDNLDKGAKLFFIWDENYNSYPIKNYEDYRKIPVMTGSLSKMNADAFNVCEKYLTLKKYAKLKYYRIYIFEK